MSLSQVTLFIIVLMFFCVAYILWKLDITLRKSLEEHITQFESINRTIQILSTRLNPTTEELFLEQSVEKLIDKIDPLYSKAVIYIMRVGKVSASLLQRKFDIGYARASKLLDLMEKRGIITPANGSIARKILTPEVDPLFDEAATLAIELGKISTPLLQRKLNIGYARSARIFDALEIAGIVEGTDSNKSVKILKDYEVVKDSSARKLL